MPDVASLLAEADWLTRLARSLTGNAADAADVVQETYVAALRSPPDPDRPARPWLRRVLVNVVRMRHRGRMRRDAREAESIGEMPHTPEQLLERARVERTLTDLVLALEEPYRTTVLLRYREGLTSEQIAKQLGVPAGTVRRRLKTALDRLRDGLDERETSKTWRAAFAPFLVPRERAPWWRLVMTNAATKTGVAVIVALLLAIGGGAAWWLKAGGGSGASSKSSAAPPSGSVTTTKGASAAKVFAQSGLGSRSLVGRVMFQGKPFAGATVRVTHGQTHTPIGEQQSAADGTFTFAELAADTYIASAVAADKSAMPVVADLRAPKVLPVQLALSSCSHLRGIVSDGSGAPIAHAHVSRFDSVWPLAETDELGHYDLCTHFGTARYMFTASGYHGVSVNVTIADASVRDMVLLPEATVAGIVRTADGKPVADAWITIDPRGKGAARDAPVFDHSGADGTFRIAGVAPGHSELWAAAPGLASRHIGLVVGAGETKEGVDVRLDPASRVIGRVLTQGQPVAGAQVGLRVGSYASTELAVTQADGSFTIDRAPRGELGILVENHTVVTPRSVHVGDGDTHVEIEARPVLQISGVVTRHGAPAPDVTVSCPRQLNPNPWPELVTDQSGEFTCPVATDGTYTLIAMDAEGRWGTTDVAMHGADAHTTIELAQDGTLCGTVSDDSGHRIRGITVNAVNPTADDSGDAVSADDGTFCVRYLGNEGSFQISTFIGGQRLRPTPALEPVKLVNHRADVAIVLPALRSSIAGIVVDEAGAPVVDVAVRARASAPHAVSVFDDSPVMQVAITDQDGHFSIDRLAPGTYALLASARDGSERSLEPVDTGTRDARLVLASAGRIEGTLAGFVTTPVVLGVLISGGHEPIDFEIDGDHFSAGGLSPGPYMLTADPGGVGGGDARRVVVTAGKTTTTTLTSRGTATISGRVLDWKTHEPVAGTHCMTPSARDGSDLGVVYNSPDDGVVSDATGAYRFDAASAGEVIVNCNSSVTAGMRFATAPRGSTTQLDVYTVPFGGLPGTIDAKINLESRSVDVVENGGQAQKAGLLVGDEVIAIDGVSVVDLDGNAITRAITRRGGGNTAVLTIKRGTTTRTVPVAVRTSDD